MVHAIAVPLQEAEKAKKFLITQKNLSHDYIPLKKKDVIYFPILSKKKVGTYTVVSVALQKKKRQGDLKKNVLGKLSKREQTFLMTAFDQVGSIAILEIPEELRQKEKIIGRALLDINPHITTVLRKEGIHSGTFRTQKMRWVVGKRTKEALYKEHGVLLKVNVEKVYFSPRLSTERKRIYKQAKKGENVLVMFSGVGPYCCVISKNTNAQEVYGVEINPVGHKYALENVKLNKLRNISLYNGDVKKVIPRMKKKFDRIVMPLPKSAGGFLDVALSVAAKGCIIHCYDFLHEDHFEEAKKKVRAACKKVKRKCRILRLVKCGQYSPRTYRICVDLVVY
jgi:tRNA (guanine37-N1)-methyltransferase